MDNKRALEILDKLVERTPNCTEDWDALIIARRVLITEIRVKDCKKCEDCLFYTPSEIYGIGKCNYKNRDETMFEDDCCSRGEIR